MQTNFEQKGFLIEFVSFSLSYSCHNHESANVQVLPLGKVSLNNFFTIEKKA